MSETWYDLGIDVGSRTSGQLHTKCPKACSRKAGKKDLSVDLDNGRYKCHNPGCGFQGYLKSERYDRAALGRSQEYDRKVFKRPDSEAYFERIGKYPKEAIDQMAARGISKETLEHFQVGWHDYVFKDDATGEWTGALLFPFYRDDELINTKKRSLDKQFKMNSGSELIFYNLDSREDTTIIVEGELDVLALYEAGVTNVISVPNGAAPLSAKSPNYEYLDNCADEMAEVRHFILAVDGDPPGVALRDELVRRFRAENCSRVEWPEGTKDANDVLQKYGAERLRAVIDSARPYPVSGIARPKTDLRDALDKWRRDGLPSGDSTGWSNLDEYWKPVPGEMTIITGVPSHGKSTWCDALLINLYRQHGWRSIVFSPENYPTETHSAKLLELVVGKSFDEKSAERWRKKGLRPEVMDDDEYEKALDEVEDAVSYIVQPADGDGLTLDQIFELARVEVYRRGSKVLVMDPWNEIEHEMTKGMSETLYISYALSKIRRFARSTGLHVIVIAHPTKLTPQTEKFKDDHGNEQTRAIYPVPDLYHISGSAAWKNKADNGISVWRDEFAEAHGANPHLNQIVITKVKRKWVGQKGSVQLVWDPVSGRFAVPSKSQLTGPGAPKSAAPVSSYPSHFRGVPETAYDDYEEEAF